MLGQSINGHFVRRKSKRFQFQNKRHGVADNCQRMSFDFYHSTGGTCRPESARSLVHGGWRGDLSYYDAPYRRHHLIAKYVCRCLHFAPLHIIRTHWAIACSTPSGSIHRLSEKRPWLVRAHIRVLLYELQSFRRRCASHLINQPE
jgi:hypothetical protein